MQDDEQEIRELVSTWMAASKAGDVEKLLSLMADDAVFLVPGRPIMRKADFAAAARAQAGPDAPQFDGSSEIHEIQILGDWAFMWTKLTVVATPPGGGQSVRRAGHTLSILKKENGKWVLARDANLLSPVLSHDDAQ
ncbi:MAG TPA: SgcJ/EcaC family oxidoreductase [Nitrospiraceae bacterium]|nr:SgcJ/EcaC family oxidoreductase [Nitrospiraceae bacterium]